MNFQASSQDQFTNSGNLKLHPGSSISFYGNFANNGSLADNGQSLTFNGSSLQVISGTSDAAFNNLAINNTAGVRINCTVSVNNMLVLTKGPLVLNSNMLYIINNSASAVSRTTGYIVSEQADNSGRVKWNIGNIIDIYTIPFGNLSGNYIPVIFNHTAGNIGNVTASTYSTATNNTPYPLTPVAVTNVDDLSGNDNSANIIDRFWQIDKDGIDGTADITFTASESETGTLTDLLAQRWNSSTSEWDAPLPGQTSGDFSVTVPGVTTFSPWLVSGLNSTLAVELFDFNVLRDGNYAALNWSTLSETDNYGFNIEKSTDLISWNFCAFVSGSGNSQTQKMYTYNDDLAGNISQHDEEVYYRLRQIDFDNAFSYSEIKSITLNNNDMNDVICFVYPNPADSYINIMTSKPGLACNVKIYNQLGSLKGEYNMVNKTQLDVTGLSSGLYQIVISAVGSDKKFNYSIIKM
ncbi:MAG: hypothetical protein A2W91_05905 [Bacteroidetes bacterium GWF2_38_335]|nr:MAG: hypothetical protein A2W91_05905 [Bacteroidetes bacterium GWF2_38_335]OFY81609.1 MAG: hypothetical protein A2281_11700 [Bacteroidetes bacterium RIFOXYA12_FULL_38_20]